MRILIDSLVAMMLAGVLAMVVLHHRQREEGVLDVATAQVDVEMMRRTIVLHAAAGDVELTEAGWPATIDPEWFLRGLPSNPLLNGERPWVEIAGPQERDLLHPQRKTAAAMNDASFWYNPYQGVVRARVPGSLSPEHALELYNLVNAAALMELSPPVPQSLASVDERLGTQE